MKISRQDPYRRRRSPLTTIGLITALIVVALLVLFWIRGGEKAATMVEKPIPAERLGH